MDEESFFDDLDRKCFNLSSWSTDLFSRTYGLLGFRLVAPLDPDKFDNASSKAKEIGIRVLIVLGTCLACVFAGFYLCGTALILGIGSKAIKNIGLYFQKNGFTHMRGKAAEQPLQDEKAKVMTWNLRGSAGGKHYEKGLLYWGSRIHHISNKILIEKPNVIVLQQVPEISLVEAIVELLQDDYAHFYTHFGTGCMIIANCPIHHFEQIHFSSHDQDEGFSCFEIKANPEDASPCARFIGLELAAGKEAKEIRMAQMAEIVDHLAKQKITLPTFFVGNANIHRDSEEGKVLSNYLYHSYLEKEPTESDVLAKQWAPLEEGGEQITDFISLFKRNPLNDHRTLPVLERGVQLINSHLVKAFDETHNTKTALSNNHAVVSILSGLKKLSEVPSSSD